MTLGEKLRQQSAVELGTFATLPAVGQIISGTVDRARYQRFLSDLYHVVWHFCPVMAAAASNCGDAYEGLRYFLYKRIEDEKGHERWVFEDCEAVGGAEFARAVKNGRPCPEVQGMISFNYWVCERAHPSGVLGMIYTLEAIASRLAGRASAGVAKALGLSLNPPQGVKFLATHGPMDSDHLQELDQVLNELDDETTSKVVVNALKVNFRLFGAALT